MFSKYTDYLPIINVSLFVALISFKFYIWYGWYDNLREQNGDNKKDDE
jgi:hypothetical protein